MSLLLIPDLHTELTDTSSLHLPTQYILLPVVVNWADIYQAGIHEKQKKISAKHHLYPNYILEKNLWGGEICYFCDALLKEVYMSPLCSNSLNARVPSLTSSWETACVTTSISQCRSGPSGHSGPALNCKEWRLVFRNQEYKTSTLLKHLLCEGKQA